MTKQELITEIINQTKQTHNQADWDLLPKHSKETLKGFLTEIITYNT
jgi:nucleoid DNA-binding protein